MEFSFKLKEFLCPLHAHQPIKKVQTHSNSQKLLFCPDCIIGESSNIKSQLVDFDSLIGEIYNSIFNSQDLRINGRPAESLLFILKEEDALVSRFAEFIFKQKMLVCSQTKRLEELLIPSIHRARDKLLNELDLQLAFLRRILKIAKTDLRDTLTMMDPERRIPLLTEKARKVYIQAE